METGTISKLDRRKLFGWIRPDQGGADVFWHESGLLNRRFANVATGYEVTFRRTLDRESGRARAVDIRVIEP